MSVTKRDVNGVATWIIDRRFKGPNGKEERYRRAAKVQLKAAAEREEMDLCLEFRVRGTIAHLLGGELQAAEAPPIAEPEPTLKTAAKVYYWEDAVDHFRAKVLPDLKASTQRNYRNAIDGTHLAHFRGRKLVDIDYTLMEGWEAVTKKRLPNDGSRRIEHIVLHSVLRSVGPNRGGKWLMLEKVPLFPEMPTGTKKQPPIPSLADVNTVMNEGSAGGRPRLKWCRPLSIERAQLAFGLSLWAGLRAGEVRALRKSDIDNLTRRITVRHSRSCGVEATTKGDDERTVAITDALWERLRPRLDEMKDPDGLVCLSYQGKRWRDEGIYSAWERTCRRLGLSHTKFHACRHYFLTKMFTFGASPVTVMKSAGHKDLKTTMRYAHFEQDDQDRAIARFSV